MQPNQQPTPRQYSDAIKAADLYRQTDEGLTPQAAKNLKEYLSRADPDLFDCWLRIETKQFERLGGTGEDFDSNDDLHEQAANFATALITETFKVRYPAPPEQVTRDEIIKALRDCYAELNQLAFLQGDGLAKITLSNTQALFKRIDNAGTK